MMKIVYCLHATFNSGGMERIVIDKANYLADKGYEVYIVTTEQRGRNSFYVLAPSVKIIDLAVNYSLDNGCLWKKVLFHHFRRLRHRMLLTSVLKKIQPDITISTFGNEVTFLHKIKYGGRKILEIHFSKQFRLQLNRSGIWRYIDLYRTYLDERLVCKYDSFVVLTEEDKRYWGNIPNITVIPNFIKVIPKLRSEVIQKKVLAVGRLSYQKGFDRLIEIWDVIHRKHKEWSLDIYGSGEERDNLLNLIEQKGLSKTITIHNPVSDLSQIYAQSSIYVLTSRYEGFPMVLLEAMSFGLPIVSYQCQCGPADLISNAYDGFLIKEDDTEAFIEKLSFLMDDFDMRKIISNNTLEKINKFRQDIIMSKWEILFMKTMGSDKIY